MDWDCPRAGGLCARDLPSAPAPPRPLPPTEGPVTLVHLRGRCHRLCCVSLATVPFPCFLLFAGVPLQRRGLSCVHKKEKRAEAPRRPPLRPPTSTRMPRAARAAAQLLQLQSTPPTAVRPIYHTRTNARNPVVWSNAAPKQGCMSFACLFSMFSCRQLYAVPAVRAAHGRWQPLLRTACLGCVSARTRQKCFLESVQTCVQTCFEPDFAANLSRERVEIRTVSYFLPGF